jgi:hypothetical protein
MIALPKLGNSNPRRRSQRRSVILERPDQIYCVVYGSDDVDSGWIVESFVDPEAVDPAIRERAVGKVRRTRPLMNSSSSIDIGVQTPEESRGLREGGFNSIVREIDLTELN